jgi:hypothetical protein
MRRYLVVANQTLCGPHLLAEVLARQEGEDAGFHVVVPATPSNEHFTWTEGEAEMLARARLDEVLERLREAGVDATGEIGDPNAVRAVRDVIWKQPFDEIILSTLPPGLSRWLRADVPSRLRKVTALPVTHVVAAVDRVE